MNKKRTAVVAVTFFLVQIVLLSGIAPAESLSPSLLTETHAGSSGLQFKQACYIFGMAYSLYNSDALDGLSKGELMKKYGSILLDPDVRFDLGHLDMKKKGWTRYYPFSVGERRFMARIFLTREAVFQQEIPVLSQFVIESAGVTMQILPSVSEILSGRSIRPNKIYSSSPVDESV